MKKRVLYFSLQPSDSTSWWRSGNIFPYINSPDFDLIDISNTKTFNWSVFAGVSILIMQRPFAPDHVAVLKVAKEMQIKCILDYDDLLTDLPNTNPVYFQYYHSQSTLNECLDLADEIWCSTPIISKLMAKGKGIVIPNAWNDYIHPIKDKRKFKKGGKSVIYRGGSSHAADVYEKSEDLVRIINNNTDWDFTFIGDRYTFLEQRCGDNYLIVGGMALVSYFQWYFSQNSNIAIFPLVKNVFNEAKSCISWMEATYSGSAFFGNYELPEFKHDGVIDISQLEVGMTTNYELLADYNEKSWQEICDTLLLSNVNEIRKERILANL